MVMWDVLVVDGIRKKMIFFMKEPDYNIMMMSTFSGFTMLEGHKE